MGAAGKAPHPSRRCAASIQRCGIHSGINASRHTVPTRRSNRRNQRSATVGALKPRLPNDRFSSARANAKTSIEHG